MIGDVCIWLTKCEDTFVDLLRKWWESDHIGIQCHFCKVNPIKGERFWCETCNVDFCKSCDFSHHPSHLVMKFNAPVDYQPISTRPIEILPQIPAYPNLYPVPIGVI